jgi:hypothetical protein
MDKDVQELKKRVECLEAREKKRYERTLHAEVEAHVAAVQNMPPQMRNALIILDIVAIAVIIYFHW